jgi:uncharacterized protein YecE (DUF72 family)
LDPYLVGTGGWAYLKVPGKPSLKAYSALFNFTEVNYTFYEYPNVHTVERWRRTVPANFTFAVRCHQDLTHHIGIQPTEQAYSVIGQMLQYCHILDAPFLVLETPARYTLNTKKLAAAKELLNSINLHGVRLVWEYRAPMNAKITTLMRDHNIIHAVDLSGDQNPAFKSDIIYSRLFGKGQSNLYQFTDEELINIDRKVLNGLASGTKTAALSYHGMRMNTDAIRFVQYKHTGQFLPATPFIGRQSIASVLKEDATFPTSKANLIQQEGWKVVDLTADKRVHLSEVLTNLPEKQYSSLNDVLGALELSI